MAVSCIVIGWCLRGLITDIGDDRARLDLKAARQQVKVYDEIITDLKIRMARLSESTDAIRDALPVRFGVRHADGVVTLVMYKKLDGNTETVERITDYRLAQDPEAEKHARVNAKYLNISLAVLKDELDKRPVTHEG